jgi:hypothetical protein
LEELFFHLAAKNWILPSEISLVNPFFKKVFSRASQKMEKPELKHLKNPYQSDPLLDVFGSELR